MNISGINAGINGSPAQQVAQKSSFEKRFQVKGPSDLIIEYLSIPDVAAVRGVCKTTRNITCSNQVQTLFFEGLPSRIEKANQTANERREDGEYQLIGGEGFIQQARMVTRLQLTSGGGDRPCNILREGNLQDSLKALVNLRTLVCQYPWVQANQGLVQKRIPDSCFPCISRSLTRLDLRGKYSECPDLRGLNQLQVFTFGRKGEDAITMSCSDVLPQSVRVLDLHWSENMRVMRFSELSKLEGFYTGPLNVHANLVEFSSCGKLNRVVMYNLTAEQERQLQHENRSVQVEHAEWCSSFSDEIEERMGRDADIHSFSQQFRSLPIFKQPENKPEQKQESKKN